ncbi:MAG: saccharopine dehydrogenase NADP-binding domain-containing protein [Planctomycetes bacterium]|nr:saccharopine dehydrogenase NADP-binding domain-containing protein [Planctomycetota bacterium]
MKRAVVLGGGMVGAIMAEDLLRPPAGGGEPFAVTLVDRDSDRLAAIAARNEGLDTRQADLAQASEIESCIADADVVCGALASHLGFAALETILKAGKSYADISFMPEDAWTLDALAKEHGATAIVDCGVAPGMSNLLCGEAVRRLETTERLGIYVGGLPRVRHLPFEYKAGFAPADVLEEYTRPSRVVEGGKVVVKEALSEPEFLDFEGVGTLEAFITDGLRSLSASLDVPEMIEKTMRYPGHRALMKAFRDTGLLSSEPIVVKGQTIVPLEVTSALLFPKWTFEEGEEDLTVMRIVAEGSKAGGERVRLTWDLLDRYDPTSGRTSMSRTTAFPAAIAARLLMSGEADLGPGVHPPERLGLAGTYEHFLRGLELRGVHYSFKEEAL